MFSEDGLYYRCRVSRLPGTQVEVRYIDYMNTEVKDATEIHRIPAALQQLPQLLVQLHTGLENYADTPGNRRILEDYLYGEGLALNIDELNIKAREIYLNWFGSEAYLIVFLIYTFKYL